MAQETLFPSAEEPAAKDQPLAARMRPTSLQEFVGQDHLVGLDHELRRAIEEDRVGSMILWGPPGSGKTTLARLIARATSSFFVPLSAVSAGVADLRRNIEQARVRRAQSGQRTILFIDEIHRFNKAQQDAVLPFVEEGVITLIGATTENPSFEVNAALLSRTPDPGGERGRPGGVERTGGGSGPRPTKARPSRHHRRPGRGGGATAEFA